MKQKIKKALRIIKQDGLKAFIKKGLKYVLKKVFKVRIRVQKLSGYESKYSFVDVIFIDGCGELLPHPARYRCQHQLEQLKANGMSGDIVYYPELSMELLKFAHTFVFFRCPETDVIKDFIAMAKSLNKTVIYDIDDLVIDTRYTDLIPYVQGLDEEGKKNYDTYVNRMGECMSMCDSAITTTERMAEELSKFLPLVYINRNTASQKMMELSRKALEISATKKASKQDISLGYFSGSITHNADYELIKPVLLRLLKEYSNLKLHVIGILDLPEELKPFSAQIVTKGFVDWQELPELIASVDINLAPIEESIFNEAKSENKFVEAALVKVPTVASRVGAFERMMEDGVTGLLVENTQTVWYEALKKLIDNEEYRNQIGENAYKFAYENCLTIYTGTGLKNHITGLQKPSVAFLFPGTGISGGIMVALKHACYLQDAGCEVTIMACEPQLDYMEYSGHKFPVVPLDLFMKDPVEGHFDKGIATMWITPEPMMKLNVTQMYYLVQNYETDFYEDGDELKKQANATYSLDSRMNYVTISKWCEEWLTNKFGRVVKYAPNGIDTSLFTRSDRDFENGKIRILIEGDSRFAYKGVDESFEIANRLPKDKYEVYYMSYTGIVKDWYKVDKMFSKVAYDEVPSVYRQCHILLKSSRVESFSYPPLEMMATGGYVVVAPNGGNVEYLVDQENCLMYQPGDIEGALAAIERIVSDESTRKTLANGAQRTALSREWENIREDILNLYGM